ncbi:MULTISPECIES: hypothetical protein [Rhodomicrobium]|uniref:hypothetical protein n=1 Tax=Rhodomicrobium TaxID=1068 RepID=UPI000B4AE8E9|nr:MULTISPECIES: hypothetical protein [Rhodomicrobium]
MIEYALLIMLGFCVGGLIAFLLAPTLWHRAVRLTTKRLEATMPMSLSDIEADKDLLRASYAIKIRRLEAGLSKTRDKSANQLVDISRLQMQIGELQDTIAALQTQLDERRNAAAVFENTIRKRFPELENAVAAAKVALDGRAYEVTDLTSKLRRREEALTIAQRSAGQQQHEIKSLRETLEKAGSDTTGRFKRRPAQWTLDEYRSEYDRLNVEMSKMREQLILGHEREAGQIAVLRTELQQLGEQIMHSVAAQERHEAVSRKAPEPEPKPWPGTRADTAPASPRRGLPGRPAGKAQPWPGEKPKEAPAAVTAPRPAAPAPEKVEAKAAASDSTAPAAPSPARQTRSRWTEPAVPQQPAAPAPKPNGKTGERSAAAEIEVAPAAAPTASPITQDKRDALRVLLDRGPRQPVRSGEAAKQAPGETGRYGVDVMEDAVTALSKEAAQTLDVEFEVVSDAPQSGGGNPAPSSEAPPSAADPKLDQVLREIIESRASAQAAPAEEPGPKAEPARSTQTASQPSEEDEGGDQKRTLLDRLRVTQERQTG